MGMMDLHDVLELAVWQQVPEQVGRLIKEAKPIQRTLQAVIKNLPCQPDYGYVFYHPQDHKLHAVLGDSDDEATYNRWENALRAIRGITSVTVQAETHPKPRDEWIMIKRAAPLGLIGHAQNFMGNLTGGPSPLTNALTGAMLTGGLGYGTGWLMERMFPEKYVERGELSRTMGLAGAGLGALPGMWQWSANARNSPTGSWTQALVQPNASAPYKPELPQHMDSFWKTRQGDLSPVNGREVRSADLAALREWLGELPPLPSRLQAATLELQKYAEDYKNQAGGFGLKPVPVDAFNRAVWNDVRLGMTAANNPFGTKSWQGDDSQDLHTPPPLAAATTALTTGIQDMYGGASMLSPKHLIRGLATAGVDLATAHVVGGVLGALGGLTPHAQQSLQQAGVWGGLIRGTVGSMLGMR